MGSPSGSTTPVVGSDRKLLLLGADKPEGKKNLQRFDAALKEQATVNRRSSDSGNATTPAAAGSPDSFVTRQRDADALATASPYASQAMNAELDADVAAAKDRIGQLDRDIDALGTSGGYVTDTLRAERDQLTADVADHDAFTNPEPADAGEDSFKDRQGDIDTIVTASPAAAQAMQNELDADVAAAKDRVAALDRDIDALGTSGGYVTDALRAERDELLANLEDYQGLSSDPSGGEDWLTDAQDNLTLDTQNFTGGVGIDIPLGTPAAELEIGAEVKIQRTDAIAYGVSRRHFDRGSLRLSEGRLLDTLDEATHAQVAIIGAKVREELFGYGPALGEKLKVDDVWLEVIGVLESDVEGDRSFQGVSLSSTAGEIYMPYSTALRKFDHPPARLPL